MAASTSSTLLGSPPIPRTRLIGRETERATARSLLVDEYVALLTLTGPGGVGKTRLALAIAADVAPHFTDGVTWVDLALLSDPVLVPAAIATALGITVSADRSITEALVANLRSTQRLLMLDNCEHLLNTSGDLVSALLTACPAVQVLATSRAPLHVRGEQEFPVDPLPLPAATVSSLEELSQNEAICLFAARARAVRPAFRLDATNAAAVAAICRHLDGLPLAIELAAPRSKLLSPGALLAEMSNRLRLLGDGPRDLPARQRTIQDAIAWSYDLLGPADQVLFRQLAVFVGGLTVPAAAAVAGINEREVITGLGCLTDQSLIRLLERQDEPRFTMLETIREFGLERLAEAGEVDAVQRAHAAHYVALAEQAELELRGPDEGLWLDRLEVELPNLRAALAWLEARADGQTALRLAGAMEWFWHMRGHPGEGRAWLERALAMHPVIPSVERAQALDAAGLLAWHQGDSVHAAARAEACLALGRELDEPAAIAGALRTLGLVAVLQGRDKEARAFHEEALSLFRALGDRFWEALGLLNLAAATRDDPAQRKALQLEALNHFRALGNPWGTALALAAVGRSITLLGDPVAGDALIREGLALNWLRRDRWQMIGSFALLGEGAAIAGHPERAARLLGAASALREAIGVSADLIHEVGDEPIALVASMREAFTEAWDAGKTLPLAEAVAEALAEPSIGATAAPSHTPDPSIAGGLTRREREVLRLLAEGHSDREIAAALFISTKTAGAHVSNLLGKLGVPSRAAAVAYIHRHRLS